MSTDYTFLKACRGEKTEFTPVWMMRQAGRFLPEYRAIRAKVSFLELCKTPELAVEVSIQPVEYLGADAAIMFSDILTPVEPMGLKFDFAPGPQFENPVRTQADIDALRIPVMEEDVPFVYETIRMLRRELEGRVPLIGFGGAPFTLACYMVEGKGSKNFAQIKRMMYGAPELYAQLMEKVTEMDRKYLNAQIAAGAQAIQIFDTWGGIMAPLDYQKYILPYTKKLIDGLDRSVPIIHFVKGAGTMIDKIKLAGSDVVGVDWHVNLGDARDILGPQIAIQGNLDPTVLYAPKAHIRSEVQRVLDENAGRPGHIFNLGHGLLPTTEPEHAKYLVDCVHELSRK